MKSVLVVEDEPALLKILAESLTKADFHVTIAKDGKEGLAMALKDHPDLILLDIIMPKMNGIEMLKNLWQDKWGKNAKVIFLTNVVGEAEKFGTYKYLLKVDWKLQDIVKEVKKIIGTSSKSNS